MDNFHIPTSILIDLSKAFDTLDHDIMPSKLRYYGVSETELKIFADYLLERFQYVDYSAKYMCFHTSNRIVIYPKLKINNFTIDRVTDFKFLGLIISSNLKWNKHIDHVSIKVSKVIGIMFRLKSIVPSDVLHTLYNSLIMPHFHYCLLTWGSKIRNGHKLHLLQKKALRLVDNNHYIAHTDPIFKKITHGYNY